MIGTAAFSLLLIVGAANAVAANSALYGEVNLLGGYSDAEEWVGEKGKALKNSVGFEWYSKFSDEFGDFLTSDLQVRLSYDTSDSLDEEWAVEFHNAWLEYKLGLGKNLRLGHFSPAFGLEPNLDTHGTLFQTLAGQDIGFKKDWGIGYRGIAGEFDYQVAAQLGSGMGIEHDGRNFLASGRIGSPGADNLQYGISVLYGEVLESRQARTIPRPDMSEGTVFKRRAGMDAQYLLGAFTFKCEATLGRNDTNDVAGALVQLDYTPPSNQSLTLGLQGRAWSDTPSESSKAFSEAGFRVSYELSREIVLRLGFLHDVGRPDDNEDTRVFLQVYCFPQVM